MDRSDFRGRLASGALLLDGAMGTVLHDRGIPIVRCFDAINRQDPDLVAEVHRQYIGAGADIIETNTFGANRYKLAKFGLEKQTVELNQAAVAVARQALAGSSRPVLLAGSVGPLGVRLVPLGRVKPSEAQAAFREQIEALLGPNGERGDGGGVDLIILETFSDLRELTMALTAARSLEPEVPVVAMMTFTRDDRTLSGETAADVAAELAALDVDAIGVNCSAGPVQALRLITAMRAQLPDVPLAVSPNAGWPYQSEGDRVVYPATPGYFARYASAFVRAGASLVGGCCGTTSQHIAAMRQALDSQDEAALPVPQADIDAVAVIAAPEQPTQLATALQEGDFVVTVEMSPPRGVAAQRMLAGARTLRESGAHFINVTDSPLARMRMSAWAAAHLVQREVGLEAILHFPTRGRNLLRVQGDLLAAHALGIRNLFVVMGDPTRIGDYPEAMDDYDIVPTGLVQVIKQRLNGGLDHAGNRIDQPTSFVVGCAANLAPADRAAEFRVLRKKIEAGADYLLTQPVFDPAAAARFIRDFRKACPEPAVPIIAGVQPLYSSGNAEFLHNEVPGISIPERLRERMRRSKDEQQEGVAIAREMLEELRPVVQGLYLIPVFGRYDLAAEVLDVLE